MEILLVEDNLEDANDTIQALKRGNLQCRVTLVCDGEEAISFLHRKGEFAQAPTPDLILLDMQLPKKEGRHVLAETAFLIEQKHERISRSRSKQGRIMPCCHWRNRYSRRRALNTTKSKKPG
jgi:response regulator RpfG family c-di-GMP phosphodiesterase